MSVVQLHSDRDKGNKALKKQDREIQSLAAGLHDCVRGMSCKRKRMNLFSKLLCIIFLCIILLVKNSNQGQEERRCKLFFWAEIPNKRQRKS